MHLLISEPNLLISPQLLVSYDFPLKFNFFEINHGKTMNICEQFSNNCKTLPGKVFKATQKSLQIFAAEQIPQRNCILE